MRSYSICWLNGRPMRELAIVSWLRILSGCTAFSRRSLHRISLAFALHALLAGDLTFAGRIERGVADLDFSAALVVSDHDARARNARSCQLVSMRRRAVGKQLFAV